MPNIIRVPGGGQTKIPSDLSPLCPNFTVERNGTKVKISADKIQLNSYTNMVSGGVWAWGKTRPTKPTGENTKLWSRAELITTGEPYDGQYLGDVTPSDAVTETLLWLPEKDGGSVKLVPFIVLSTDYLGGVYVMRQKGNKDWIGKYGNNVTYENSTADTWLTSYLNSVLDKSIVDKVLECEIHVFEQGTIKRKCWIPSYGELYSDFTDSGNTFMPYFNSNGRRALIKQDDGNLLSYWTRTFYNLSNVRMINPDGSGYFQSASNKTAAYRPSFVLPKDFQIQQRPDGSYTVWNEQGLMKLGDIEASTKNKKVSVNITEVLKSGNKQMNAPFVYAMKDYNGSGNSLMVRDNNLFVTGAMNGPMWSQTNAYQILVQYSTMEHTKVTAVDRSLHSSIRAIIKEVSVKSTDSDGALHDDKASCFLLSTSEYGLGDKNTGNAIPYYSVQGNRIHKNGSGVVSEGWTRDAAKVSVYNYYFIGQDGQYFSKPSGNQFLLRPCFVIPPTTPIRQLADGSYDLVPDDPALATRGISTMADEEEVPLEIELDWPESDPFIARQWVYNEKGVYQTMLLGGIASTEDAPAFELPVFTGNCAVFGDETAGRIELYESGTLTLYPGIYDMFAVGGGSQGESDTNIGGEDHGGPGGGSGYTSTVAGYQVTTKAVFSAVVGAGGTYGGNGQTASVLRDAVSTAVITANAADVFAYNTRGGNGGSGGGAYNSFNSYAGGSDGSNGGGAVGGAGQGTTTRSFGESDGVLYAGGGGSGAPRRKNGGAGGSGGGGAGGNAASSSSSTAGAAGTPNTGSGGGGSGDYTSSTGGAGGSGIIIVRWNNAV